MHMIRTRPFSLARDFDTLFQTGFGAAPTNRSWIPRVDVFETDDTLNIRYELAGFSIEDLNLTFEDGLLTVKGKRTLEAPEGARVHRTELTTGSFARTLRVTDAFDPDSVKASFSNGLLEVTLAKRPEVLPRSIEIEAS